MYHLYHFYLSIHFQTGKYLGVLSLSAGAVETQEWQSCPRIANLNAILSRDRTSKLGDLIQSSSLHPFLYKLETFYKPRCCLYEFRIIVQRQAARIYTSTYIINMYYSTVMGCVSDSELITLEMWMGCGSKPSGAKARNSRWRVKSA